MNSIPTELITPNQDLPEPWADVSLHPWLKATEPHTFARECFPNQSQKPMRWVYWQRQPFFIFHISSSQPKVYLSRRESTYVELASLIKRDNNHENDKPNILSWLL
jgi:hypothetical protein